LHARDAELTLFLESLQDAVGRHAPVGSDARRVMHAIGQALRTVQPPASPEPVWLPTCAHLDEAVRNVVVTARGANADRPASSDTGVVAHARSLLALSTRLAWWRRPDASLSGSSFADHHANATLIGPGGLEEREDVWVGVSLMAPDTRYPEHHHLPEEVYLVMSGGHWQQSGGAWQEPRAGGVVYNSPDSRHAMRSGSRPLLATWCLWRDR